MKVEAWVPPLHVTSYPSLPLLDRVQKEGGLDLSCIPLLCLYEDAANIPNSPDGKMDGQRRLTQIIQFDEFLAGHGSAESRFIDDGCQVNCPSDF